MYKIGYNIACVHVKNIRFVKRLSKLSQLSKFSSQALLDNCSLIVQKKINSSYELDRVVKREPLFQLYNSAEFGIFKINCRKLLSTLMEEIFFRELCFHILVTDSVVFGKLRRCKILLMQENYFTFFLQCLRLRTQIRIPKKN